MKAGGLRRWLRFSLIGGLALFLYLAIEQGVTELAQALKGAGWGLALVAALHLAPMAADTLGWQRLVPAKARLPFATMLWARWIGESINALLPVAQVGGDLVKVRLLGQRGMPGEIASASVVVELTLAVFTQILFTLLGLTLLVLHLGGGHIAQTLLTGTGVLGVLLLAFSWTQRRGLFSALVAVVGRFASGRSWQALTDSAVALDRAISHTYANRRALLACCAWLLAGWFLGTAEVWLIMALLGQPVGWTEALLLESLGQAVRAAAFLVPGALGVQEGGYLLLGGLLGLEPPLALALSLAKRARELSLGLPGLVAWQIAESHGWWRERRRRSPQAVARPDGE
jgi:putative membrane protein